MKNLKNKGFTLVELIIVITILAILATIAFISFQGYTAESSDAKVKSEIANIRNVIEAKNAEGVGLLNFVDDTATNSLSGITIGGKTPTTGTEYKASKANTTLITTIDAEENDYRIGASTLAGGVYQIAGSLKKEAVAYVLGTYNPRDDEDTATGSVTGTTTKVITLSTGLGLFKLNDAITDGANTGTVTGISSDLSRLSLDSNATLTGATVNIYLEVSESDGLIADKDDKETPVVNNGTALPYKN